MDDELRQLQALFSAAQEARSSVRLSERNIVELVNKLRELKLLEDSLLHTLNGKEYITRERLRSEVEDEIRRCRRVTTVDLAASLGVDLFYCERECQELAASDPNITIVQGEVLTTGYWDDVAEEVEETLQGAGRLAIADLARRFAVGAELLGSIIADRLGKIIHGKLEGGQLYTPAHLARVKAMVRGALRATTVACPVSVLWSLLHQLQGDSATPGMTEGVSASLYQTTLAEVVKEGAALGTMRAGGASWTPAPVLVQWTDALLKRWSTAATQPVLTLSLHVSQGIFCMHTRIAVNGDLAEKADGGASAIPCWPLVTGVRQDSGGGNRCILFAEWLHRLSGFAEAGSCTAEATPSGNIQ